MNIYLAHWTYHGRRLFYSKHHVGIGHQIHRHAIFLSICAYNSVLDVLVLILTFVYSSSRRAADSSYSMCVHISLAPSTVTVCLDRQQLQLSEEHHILDNVSADLQITIIWYNAVVTTSLSTYVTLRL